MHKELSVKSRVRGDFHARFCERVRVKLPRSTRPMTPDSKDYEDALRLCISLGGDADTMGAITGAIAGAYYHQIPASLYEFGINILPEDMKDIINKFDREHGRIVSYKWYNPEFPKEDLVRKVRSGEIFI